MGTDWISDEENKDERVRQQEVIEKLKKRDNIWYNIQIVGVFFLVVAMVALFALGLSEYTLFDVIEKIVQSFG